MTWWPSASPEPRASCRGVHDVSAGGLGVALAEMALAAGVGVATDAVCDHAALFSEAPSCFVVATQTPGELLARAADAGVGTTVLGRAGGPSLTLGGLVSLPVERLHEAWTGAIPVALGDRA